MQINYNFIKSVLGSKINKNIFFNKLGVVDSKHSRNILSYLDDERFLQILNNNHSIKGVFTNKKLSNNIVNSETGSYLHQFKWLKDNEIGSLDERWNWLEGWTSNHNSQKPFAVHYTRGGPWFEEWKDVEFATEWTKERDFYLRQKFSIIK